MKQFVFDSYAIIAYLERERGAEKVAQLLDDCVSNNKRALLCVVNWGEVYYNTLRETNEKTAVLALDTIKTLPIDIVEANKELTLHAATYKATRKMSYADCFAAALTKLRKAELVTGDKEFKSVENEIKILWI